MFKRHVKPEPMVSDAPEEISNRFRGGLQRTMINNANEIAELETIIHDAQKRLEHRRNVERALNAAMIELTVADAVAEVHDSFKEFEMERDKLKKNSPDYIPKVLSHHAV